MRLEKNLQRILYLLLNSYINILCVHCILSEHSVCQCLLWEFLQIKLLLHEEKYSALKIYVFLQYILNYKIHIKQCFVDLFFSYASQYNSK